MTRKRSSAYAAVVGKLWSGCAGRNHGSHPMANRRLAPRLSETEIDTLALRLARWLCKRRRKQSTEESLCVSLRDLNQGIRRGTSGAIHVLDMDKAVGVLLLAHCLEHAPQMTGRGRQPSPRFQADYEKLTEYISRQPSRLLPSNQQHRGSTS